MGELRRVRRRGNSWVIAMPYTIRDHLGVRQGGDLYWHLGPKGSVVLATSKVRVGGKPPGSRLDKDLAAAQQTIAKLHRQLRNRPTVAFNEGVNEGFHMHASGLVKLGAEVSALRDELRDVAARIPFAARRPAARRPGAVTSASAPPASIDHIPTEPLPSGVVGGGDAASGDSIPQAAHE